MGLIGRIQVALSPHKRRCRGACWSVSRLPSLLTEGNLEGLVGRAVTSAAIFSVAPGLGPLLFKIDSAASILTTLKLALIAIFISEKNNFLKHNCKKRAGETLIIV